MCQSTIENENEAIIKRSKVQGHRSRIWPELATPKRCFKGGQRLQNVEFRGGKSYLCLTINHGTVSMTQEPFLSVISLPMLQTLSNGNKRLPNTTVAEGLVVVNLLRNESHADVYLVRSSNSPSKVYHAHVFLSDGWSEIGQPFTQKDGAMAEKQRFPCGDCSRWEENPSHAGYFESK